MDGRAGRPHIAGLASPIDRFEEVCLDLHAVLAPARAPPADVIIVAVDDETVRQAGGYPLPRQRLAAMVEAIDRQKPKAIAIDMLFVDAGPPGGDEALARALSALPTVVAAGAVFDAGQPARARSGEGLPQPTAILQPIATIAQVAEVGVVNLSTGFGGVPRHVPLLVANGDDVAPSFVLLAVALATGQTPRFAGDAVVLGQRSVTLDAGRHLVLRHYGPNGTIPRLSGAALESPGPPALADKIVIVGVTALGAGDTFPTPFSSVVPGVEILATAIANLSAGDSLVRTRSTRWIDAGAAAVLVAATVGLIAAPLGIVGPTLVLGLAVAWFAFSFVAFCQGYWISTALPLAAMAPVAAMFGAARLWQERRLSFRLAEAERGLRPFQPRPLSDHLASDPGFLAEPRIQEAAVLFVDLAGFTTLSETADPVHLRDLLKSFHGLVDRTVDRHGGYVATFMGDGAMMLFGFPDLSPDDARRAILAAATLEDALALWGRSADPGGARVAARIAAHWGPVVISRLGGDTHQQITATGDTVNVASRLLETAKQARVPTVVSEALVRAAGPDQTMARFSEPVEVPIRGREQPIRVRLSCISRADASEL